MNSSFTPETYSELLDSLNRLRKQRSEHAEELRTLQTRFNTADFESEDVHDQLAQLEETWQTERVAMEERHAGRISEIETRYQTELAAIESQAKRESSEAKEHAQLQIDRVESEHDENRWIMTSLVDESADNNPKKQLETFRTQIERRQERLAADWEELTQLAERAEEVVKSRRHDREEPVELQAGPGANRETTQTRFDDAAREARKHFETLQSQFLSRLLSGTGIIWVGLLLWLPSFAVLAWVINPAWLGLEQLADIAWILTSAGVTFLLMIIVLGIIWFVSARKTWEAYQPLREHIADAYQNYKSWRKFAKTELTQMEATYEEKYRQLEEHRESSLERFTRERDENLASYQTERDRRLRLIESERAAQSAKLRNGYERERSSAEEENQAELAHLDERFESEKFELIGERERQHNEQTRQLENCQNRMEADWQSGISELSHIAADWTTQAREDHHAWKEILAEDWQPATEIPSGIPLGNYHLDISTETDVLDDEEPPTISVPAVLPFPHSPSVVLKTGATGRGDAVAVQQTLLLRLMSQLPPATVRLTICDPVGLGEPFAAFMHLADYDELLITTRIWTESAHIEEQLAKLTEHLENVFQKYLRNEFESIEEYNQKAGEVAEPYRILVISGFPHGFSERAAARLTSIASSGPRCGVYLLIGVDTRQQMPRGFELSDLEANATVFRYEGGQFLTNDFGTPPLPLEFDPPPESGVFTDLVRKMGDLSRSIRRVEVPFHRISPSEDRIWKSDSRRMVDVSLGRSGATKLQQMQLGLGTSQHVLVAGKTGSGKSTLLHVLITNLALNYSPNEIEFFLIDFKKGVEFKAYANLNLPHARVVAIESDREFGVSVLERLDEILKERGEIFREQGVQDLQSFRNNAPDVPMPRILLVVDEFQEFFTEDDRVFQTASLLLDRLVRQGRAFGIHVLLGSQTLGGAYSLARTTISQMAVRIALQCSETDAHLILSDDNTAARLLTRPGEAIYNDANGMMEGNSLFQIGWLGDEERDQLLGGMAKRAREEHIKTGSMIVFEGNLPADPACNRVLSRLLEQKGESSEPSSVIKGWLGEPVSITDPVSVSFRSQPGNHLLIVGTERPPALGMMTTTLVGLAIQAKSYHEEESQSPLAYVLNGQAGEAETDEAWQRVCEAAPAAVTMVSFAEVSATIATLREEITLRQESPSHAHPPVFLVVFDLSRYRELSKSEDDFGLGGFGNQEKTASPGKMFGEILREGGSVGVHVIAWCHSYNTVDRSLGRQLLKEFEMRIAFQMSAGDSSSLIDNPSASRLGPNRAILYLDDQGSHQKFRPYGRPSDEWLARVKSVGSTADETPEETLVEPLESLDDLSDLTIQ